MTHKSAVFFSYLVNILVNILHLHIIELKKMNIYAKIRNQKPKIKGVRDRRKTVDFAVAWRP